MRLFGHLLRKDDQKLWSEYENDSVMEIVQTGVSIRDSSSCTLLCDIPRPSITECKWVGKRLLRMRTSSDETIAFRLDDRIDKNGTAEELTLLLKDHFGVDATMKEFDPLQEEFEVPNLNNPEVQRFILDLVFNDEFAQFVDQIESLLKGYETTISKTTSK